MLTSKEAWVKALLKKPDAKGRTQKQIRSEIDETLGCIALHALLDDLPDIKQIHIAGAPENRRLEWVTRPWWAYFDDPRINGVFPPYFPVTGSYVDEYHIYEESVEVRRLKATIRIYKGHLATLRQEGMVSNNMYSGIIEEEASLMQPSESQKRSHWDICKEFLEDSGPGR